MTPNEQVDRALVRGRVYGFLRRVFTHEVDEPLLEWCREQDRAGLWSGLGMDLEQALDTADGAGLEDLAIDFCQLFITSGAHGVPHESVQGGALDGGDLLFGDAASAVKHLYREAGFELEEEAHLLPDALGVEFEFMERLAQAEAEARRKGDAEELTRLEGLQRRMLDDHLGRWVPGYARRMKADAGTDFYRAMLDLAADFVEWSSRET